MNFSYTFEGLADPFTGNFIPKLVIASGFWIILHDVILNFPPIGLP